MNGETYTAEAELFESVWKRPRWLTPKKMVRVSLEIEEPGIPNGQVKWGGDRKWSAVTMPATSIQEAVKKFVLDVEKERQEHEYYQYC